MRILVTLLVVIFIAPVAAHAFLRHWIESVADDGAVIVLEDHSVWGISTVDRVRTSVWLPVDNVTVEKSDSKSDYPYLLTDSNRQNSVHAKYMGTP
jgi:hypothetical protein